MPLPTTGWADTWMLAAKAPHPNCAYKWMQYVTTPKVEAQQAIVFGETPVNPLACPYMNKLQKGSCAAVPPERAGVLLQVDPLLEDADRRLRVGTTKQTASDYNAWQQAWTQITG